MIGESEERDAAASIAQAAIGMALWVVLVLATFGAGRV